MRKHYAISVVMLVLLVSFAYANARFELLGLCKIGDTISISVYDREQSVSTWIVEGRSRSGIRFIRASVEDLEARVEYGGREFSLYIDDVNSVAFGHLNISPLHTNLSEDEFSTAVRTAVDYLFSNPGASFLDAPLPRGVKASLLKSYNLGVSLKGKDSAHTAVSRNSVASFDGNSGSEGGQNAKIEAESGGDSVDGAGLYDRFDLAVQSLLYKKLNDYLVGKARGETNELEL